jgi:hypothetical protein
MSALWIILLVLGCLVVGGVLGAVALVLYVALNG